MNNEDVAVSQKEDFETLSQLIDDLTAKYSQRVVDGFLADKLLEHRSYE